MEEINITTPPISPMLEPNDNKPGKIKLLLTLFLVVMAVVILILAIYFLWSKLKKDNKTDVSPAVVELQKQQFDTAIDNTYKTDKDFDGISDEDEKKYKTNPELSDTDGDGLTDYAEIFIYKSDPLKQDTDGDGYIDGLEVRNGYSPIGSGKL